MTCRPFLTAETKWTLSLQILGYPSITLYISRKGCIIPEFVYLRFEYGDARLGEGAPILYEPPKGENLIGQFLEWSSRSTQQVSISWRHLGVIRPHLSRCYVIRNAAPTKTRSSPNGSSSSSNALI